MRSAELGLDSLISVDIRTWFLKNFQVSIPVLKILSNETMSNLALLALENVPPELVPNLPRSEESTSLGTSSDSTTSEDHGSSSPTTESWTPIEKEKINWDAESGLTDDLDKIADLKGAEPAVSAPPKVVVLTGVSGLLGHHLLNYLLHNTAAEKIICLAVRQLGQRLKAQHLPKDNRVVYYEGDLSEPRLGLSKDDARAVFAAADAIIHNGADTSHLKFYPAVRAANVGSTRELVKMALPRRIPIHYVSSVGAALFQMVDVVRPVSAAAACPPGDGSHGYMASKWTCERLLERVNAKYGLGAWIHRPSTIVREGEDAEGEKAQKDWVNALLAYVRTMKAAPRVKHIRGALDLVHVQSVCVELARHVFGEARPKGAVAYVHEVGDVVLPLDRLNEVGRSAGSGKVAEMIPMEDWIDKAVAAGLHPGVAALIEAMDTPGTPDYPRLERGSTYRT